MHGTGLVSCDTTRLGCCLRQDRPPGRLGWATNAVEYPLHCSPYLLCAIVFVVAAFCTPNELPLLVCHQGIRLAVSLVLVGAVGVSGLLNIPQCDV